MKKRLSLLLIIFMTLTHSLTAQTNEGPFRPAISIGTHIGYASILGDVSPGLGYIVGVYGQKSLNRIVDVKLDWQIGRAYGANYTPSTGFRFNHAYNGLSDPNAIYDTATARVYHNYFTKFWTISGDLKINVNRIISQFGSTGWDAYICAGIGSMFYTTYVDALDGDGNVYNYETITVTDPGEVQSALVNLRDGKYETRGEQDFYTSRSGDYIIKTTFNIGGGARIKINEKLGIGIEGRYSYVQDDLLDAQQWMDDDKVSEDTDAIIRVYFGIDYTLGSSRF